MALTLKKFRISCPSKTSKEWATDTTIIKQGEFVHDSDLDRVKIGDGTKTFSQLPWAYLSSSEIQTMVNAHANRTDNPHKVTKSQVGLSNVENKTVAQILASAALTGTPTAPTAVAGVSNTQIANTQYVNTAISNAIAASDAMIFKGTLGTGGTRTTLPTTYKTGWTYRVISAGTYAGQQCEIGDLVIALVDRSGSGNVNSDWTVAQTNINGAITNMSGSNPIQVTGSGSSRTVQHMTSGVTAGTYRSVTVNNMGHVIDGSNPVTDIAEGGTNNTSFTNNTVIIYDGNKLASSGITTAKLNYLSGVTSDIQTQLNGKAASSHTHNYAGSSSAGGPANSVKANMVVKLNSGTTEGTNMFTFNGSAAKTVNITASSIGAAATTHTHNYAGSSSPGGAATSANKVNSTLTIRRKKASSTSSVTDYSTMATFNGASAVNLTLDPLSMESAGLMVRDYEYSGGESGGTGAEIFNDYRYTNGYHNNKATGDYSSAHGSLTKATGNYSTAMGYKTTASGSYSFAVGNSCTAGSGAYTMALGTNSVASGVAAFAAGNSAQATGSYSVSLGNGTIASAANQTVVGSYNSSSSSTANRFIVGGGDSSTRSNAMRVNTSGQVFGTGAFVSSGADYAELFEWEDGNPNNEDRRGLFVTLNGKYIAIANSSDEYILGIISSNPCIIGDSQSEEWHGKYVRDEFGQIVTEDVLVPAITDENGIVIQEEHTEEIAIISEDFDETKTYIPRLERSEWDAVGLLGKLIVKDDGSADVNDYLTTTTGGIGTKSTHKTRFRVMERLDDNLVMVIYK